MMYLNELMEEKNMTCAALSRASSIPESTLRDILNNKTRLDRCEVTTVMCLADALDTTVEDIMINYWEESFDEEAEEEPEKHKLHDDSSMLLFYIIVESALYKLSISDGMDYVRSICEYKWIDRFYASRRYRCAFFLLGLIDYLCRKHRQKLESRYDAFRGECLDQPVYSLRTLEEADNSDEFEEARAFTEVLAVPEMAHFNIYMTEKDITPKK